MMSENSEHEGAEEKDIALDAVSAELRDFLSTNPEAKMKRDGTRFVIQEPWGDDTVAIVFDERDEDLFASLNSVRLPPQFTALFHKAEKKYEFIWTALPVDDEQVSRRAFVFCFKSKEYRCEFGESSEALLEIAKHGKPVAPPTDTGHRNLQSFNLYFHYKREHPQDEVAQGTPLSFWIHDVDLSFDETVELCRNLNFFSSYYDRTAPHINIHEIGTSDSLRPKRLRFPHGHFPERINGRSLDPYLLGIWESANNSTDPFRLYLYYYQIIEYAAFYHIRDQVYNKIRRLLAAPDVGLRPEAVIRDISDHLSEDRRHDTQKFQDTIQDLVDPELVWRGLSQHLDHFTKRVVFDGGLSIDPLVKEGWDLEDFKAAWLPKFPTTVREIRNGLVHARESRQAAVIAPHERNYDRLRPWLDPMMVTASQVMLYWDR